MGLVSRPALALAAFSMGGANMLKNRQSLRQAEETAKAVARVDNLLRECDKRRIDPIQALEDSVREYDNECGPLPQFQQRDR